MDISDIFNVLISTLSAAVTQAGFGIPLILAPNATFPERVRTYTSLAGVLVDFAITTPEYKAAAVMFAQSPRPPQIRMGRCANKPTQRYTITGFTVTNSRKYDVKVDDVLATFTSDASATRAEIAAGVSAAIDALTGYTCSVSGGVGSEVVNVVATTPGSFLSLEVVDPSAMTISQDHADPGVAADLAAIALENNDWYAPVNPHNSQLMALAISAWVEANEKLYVCATNQTECITVADGAATDLMKAAKTAAYARTSVWYHPDPSDFLDAALLARLLPLTPGSETWNGKTLSGPAPVALTATHVANLKAKYGNSYATVAGSNRTFDGKVAANEWIDFIRYRDKLKARCGERLVGRLFALDKIAYTDPGVAILEAEIAAELAQGVRDNALSDNPAPTTTFDKVALSSSGDKIARAYNGGRFTANYAGAIHGGQLNGTISF